MKPYSPMYPPFLKITVTLLRRETADFLQLQLIQWTKKWKAQLVGFSPGWDWPKVHLLNWAKRRIKWLYKIPYFANRPNVCSLHSLYKSNRISECLSVCVTKDLSNHWTYMALLYSEALYSYKEGLFYVNIPGRRQYLVHNVWVQYLSWQRTLRGESSYFPQ